MMLSSLLFLFDLESHLYIYIYVCVYSTSGANAVITTGIRSTLVVVCCCCLELAVAVEDIKCLDICNTEHIISMQPKVYLF